MRRGRLACATAPAGGSARSDSGVPPLHGAPCAGGRIARRRAEEHDKRGLAGTRGPAVRDNDILLVDGDPDDVALVCRALAKGGMPNKAVVARD